MGKFQKDGPAEVVFQGRMIELVHQKVQNNGKSFTLEYARRAPGCRLMIIKDGKLLVTKEYRHELEDYDYRLPGGKVVDSLEEYEEIRNEDLLPYAEAAAKKECMEETGLIAKSAKHHVTAHSGATIEWDLWYFIVDDFEEHEAGQQLEHGELIDIEWKSFDEVVSLVREGKMREYRTVGVLMQYFLENNIIA